MGDSYGACGFISEKCENPLGEGVTTTFYIGYLNQQHNFNMPAEHTLELSGGTSFGPVTQNKNGKQFTTEEVSIFYELKQDTIGYLSGVWFNVFEKSVIDFRVKVITSDLEEITLPRIYVDIFCFCNPNPN